jgi:hypothetical protein
MTRTKRSKLIFARPFQLKGVDRLLPAGEYELVSDEELLEGVSFPVYRRVASWIITPSKSSATEMLSVDPGDLAAAHKHDLALPTSSPAKD